MTSRTALAGIFVGGASLRMGGRPKGLLRTRSGLTLLDRWVTLFCSLGIEVVLVGERKEYRAAAVPLVRDDPAGIGPLGGLVALLRAAGDRRAVAVAVDMPYASPALVRKLVSFSVEQDAAAVAPRRQGRWEPLFATYDPTRALPAAIACRDAGQHSLQRLFDRLETACLPLAPHEERELVDWDTPEDRSHA